MKRPALVALTTVLALGCEASSAPPASPLPDPDPPPVLPPPYEPPPWTPPWPEAEGPGELPAPEARLRRFDLTLAPADLAALEAEPYWDVMYPAVVSLDGREARGLVRFRGASSRARPQKSWRIDLDPGHALEGRDRFALLAEYDDAAKLVERFAVDLYRALGLPVPWARFVKLYVNGEHRGTYLDMERVGGEYLVHHGMDEDASIYRCGGRNCEMKQAPRFEPSYQQDFTKTRDEALPWDDLDALLRVIARTDDADLEARLGEVMDLDAYLGNLAADELIANNVLEDARSYWVHERARDAWTYVPWDLNNAQPTFSRELPPNGTLGGVWRESQVFSIYDGMVKRIYDARVAEREGQKPTWSVLVTRIWDHPALRARLLAKLEAALHGAFTPERVAPYLDALWAAVGPEILADPFVDAARAATEPDRLVAFVRDRRGVLLGRLGALRAHGQGPLVVNEVGMPTDAGPGYVELLNRGEADLDLSGAHVTDDLRVPGKYALPPGTIVPAHGHLLLVADGTPWSPPPAEPPIDPALPTPAEPGPAPEEPAPPPQEPPPPPEEPAPPEPLRLPFTLSPSGGELGVFAPGTVHAPYDLVYFGPRTPGSAYRRWPDGAEAWGEGAPTPGQAN